MKIADNHSTLYDSLQLFLYLCVQNLPHHIKENFMYKLNELAFEAMLENAKRNSNGNPAMRITVDGLSYEYNREQYNDCLRHINEENNHIVSICNRINQRGNFISLYELQELQKHIQMRDNYEVKCMKHFLSGYKDVESIQNDLLR